MSSPPQLAKESTAAPGSGAPRRSPGSLGTMNVALAPLPVLQIATSAMAVMEDDGTGVQCVSENGKTVLAAAEAAVAAVPAPTVSTSVITSPRSAPTPHPAHHMSDNGAIRFWVRVCTAVLLHIAA